MKTSDYVQKLLADRANEILAVAATLPDTILDARDKTSLARIAADWTDPSAQRTQALRDLIRVLPLEAKEKSGPAGPEIAYISATIHTMRQILLSEALACARSALLNLEKAADADGTVIDACKAGSARKACESASIQLLRWMIGVNGWKGSNAIVRAVKPDLGEAFRDTESAWLKMEPHADPVLYGIVKTASEQLADALLLLDMSD